MLLLLYATPYGGVFFDLDVSSQFGGSWGLFMLRRRCCLFFLLRRRCCCTVAACQYSLRQGEDDHTCDDGRHEGVILSASLRQFTAGAVLPSHCSLLGCVSVSQGLMIFCFKLLRVACQVSKVVAQTIHVILLAAVHTFALMPAVCRVVEYADASVIVVLLSRLLRSIYCSISQCNMQYQYAHICESATRDSACRALACCPWLCTPSVQGTC